MSTRGLVGFVLDGEVKASYNHSDSYPSWLGCEVVKAVQAGIDPEKIRALKMVNDEDKPTLDEQANLLQHANLGVSTGKTEEWYVLLRDLQGDLLGTLEAGYMIDGLAFAGESLHCEWGYLVNLDTGMLEIYRGFVKSKDDLTGRFSDLPPVVLSWSSDVYYPITLIREVAFELLTDDLMGEIEKSVYASYDYDE